MKPITGVRRTTLWTGIAVMALAGAAVNLGCASHDQMPMGAVRPTSMAQVQKAASGPVKIPPQYAAEIAKQQQERTGLGAQQAISIPKPGGAGTARYAAPPSTPPHKAT